MSIDDTIPPGYLTKGATQNISVRLVDLAALLLMVHLGAIEENVGFEDTHHTLQSLTRRMNKQVFISQSHIESALWSANLMDEAGKFWHPEGLSFDQLAKRLAGTNGFNKTYNTIEGKGN